MNIDSQNILGARRAIKNKRLKLWAALSVSSAVSCLLGVAPALADTSDNNIETVTVTATKRPQTELSVPISMAVLSEEELTRSQVLGIEDLGHTTPNVEVAEFGDGQYRLIYRGVGATGTSDNENFNVAYDGTVVPYGNAYRLFDLRQVEILRGPQGTLYGRNTNAGLINIVPEDGSQSTSYLGDVYGGSFGTVGGWAAFGGPVDDSGFFYRVAVRGEETNGFINDPAAKVDHSNRDTNGTLRLTGGWESGPWEVKAVLTADRYYGYEDDLTPASSPYRSIAPDVGRTQGWLTMPIVTVSYKGDGYTFTSITSYADTARLLDFSAVVAPLLIGQFDRRDALTQEFRLSGDSAIFGFPTNWITGLFFMNDEDAFLSTDTLTHPVVAQLLLQDQHQNTKTEALYGEAVTNWSDHWQTTLGLRFADEQQKYDFILSAHGALMHSSQSYPTIQPKFVLSYLPDKDSQIYASVTRGFRSGGVFVNNALQDPTDPSYKQEGTWQYELGYKSSLDNGHLQLQADAYYIDWSNLQVQESILSVSPPGIFSVVNNATSARSYGAEGSIDWLPTEGLQVFLKAGSTNARYTDFHPTPAINDSGNRIEEVPDFSAGAGFDYLSSIGLELSGDVTRYGSMEYDSANSVGQKPYTLLNTSLAYNLNNWRLSVSGHNLLDEKYGDRGLTSAGKAYIHAAAPASVMAELSFRY